MRRRFPTTLETTPLARECRRPRPENHDYNGTTVVELWSEYLYTWVNFGLLIPLEVECVVSMRLLGATGGRTVLGRIRGYSTGTNTKQCKVRTKVGTAYCFPTVVMGASQRLLVRAPNSTASPRNLIVELPKPGYKLRIQSLTQGFITHRAI